MSPVYSTAIQCSIYAITRLQKTIVVCLLSNENSADLRIILDQEQPVTGTYMMLVRSNGFFFFLKMVNELLLLIAC